MATFWRRMYSGAGPAYSLLSSELPVAAEAPHIAKARRRGNDCWQPVHDRQQDIAEFRHKMAALETAAGLADGGASVQAAIAQTVRQTHRLGFER